MIDLDAPIVSLDHAEAYFKAMGCSHFHMSRESFDRYDEYRALAIDKATEAKWIAEEFERYLSKLMDEADAEELWVLHSRLHDLYECFGNEPEDKRVRDKYFDKVLSATREAARRAKGRSQIIIAETILGRTEHRVDGMIVEASCLNRPGVVVELHRLVDDLLRHEEPDRELDQRRGKGIELNNKLKFSLQR
jgi:N-acetylglutamate synthase-like GNAT family acetyltransferase